MAFLDVFRNLLNASQKSEKNSSFSFSTEKASITSARVVSPAFVES
jgi:hypothetical protein